MKKLFFAILFLLALNVNAQTSINFKKVTGTTKSVLVVDRIELNLQAKNATVYYQIVDTTKGEILYSKPLRYDTGNEYPDYANWYYNYNSDQFLIDEFWASLTKDEKIFIIKN